MENADVEKLDATPEPPTRRQRAIAFVKRNAAAFVAGGSAIVIAGLGIALKQANARNVALATENANLAADNWSLIDQVFSLKELAYERDSRHLELASDALRNGSSLGGKALADWRNYINDR